MTSQFSFILISLGFIAACGQRAQDAVVNGERQASSNLTAQANQPAAAIETAAVQRQPTPNDPAVTGDPSEADESFQPIQMRWVPGKTSKVPFDMRSRIRARADRTSMGVLVLALDTATGVQRTGTMPRYVVADSAAITGLRPGDMFTDYCNVGSALPNGRLGGLVSGKIMDQPQRPRLAWRFDAAAFRIRSIPPDSVSCILLEPD